MSPRRLYIAECILLLTIVTPLAMAEGNWYYLATSAICALLGYQCTIQHDRPILGWFSSRVAVVGAFAYLLYEYFEASGIAVVALSHFMTLVCASKLIQRRTLRDDTQFLVLCLLMLVVAAIVSGNLLFPLALAVFLTIGLDTLIRLQLTVDRAQAEQSNRTPDMVITPVPDGAPMHWPTLRVTTTLALFVTLTGTGVFIFCPRLAANTLFPRLENVRSGVALTGLSNTLDFNTIGPIQASDRPVMRVQMEIDGRPVGEMGTGPYFRSVILTQYRCDQPAAGTGWEWRRMGGWRFGGRFPVTRESDEDGYINLIPDAPMPEPSQVLVQRYWLEPAADASYIGAIYPALRLRIESAPISEIRKQVDDQVMPLQRSTNKGFRYTAESPLEMTPPIAEALARERGRLPASDVDVVLPDTKLPRESDILRLTAPMRRGLEPLSDAKNRREFARRVQSYLRSSEFGYTLNRPQRDPGVEPIGDFLLRRKRGHCEYFASAMAVICQLNGVPARLVAGYCGGEYNPVGHFYLVRQKHAHSWVEVFIPGEDWVTFDPTPAAGTQPERNSSYLTGVTRYLDYLQFQWANMVVSYDADQRKSLYEKFSAWVMRPAHNEDTLLGIVVSFVRELFGWRLKLNWEERLIYWIFASLVFVGVVLILYVVARGLSWATTQAIRIQREYAARTVPPEVAFYARFCRQLESWGVIRPPGQTPAEFAQEFAAAHPAWSAAVDVVDAYYRVAFGEQRLPPERLDRIQRFLDRLAAQPAPALNPPAVP